MFQFQWVGHQDKRIAEYVNFISDSPRGYKQKFLYLPFILSPGKQVVCVDDSRDCFLLMIHTESPAEFEAPAAYYFYFKGLCFIFNAAVVDGDDVIVFNVYKLDCVFKESLDVLCEIKGVIKAALECLAEGFYISRVVPDSRGVIVNFDSEPISIDYSKSVR